MIAQWLHRRVHLLDDGAALRGGGFGMRRELCRLRHAVGVPRDSRGWSCSSDAGISSKLAGVLVHAVRQFRVGRQNVFDAVADFGCRRDVVLKNAIQFDAHLLERLGDTDDQRAKSSSDEAGVDDAHDRLVHDEPANDPEELSTQAAARSSRAQNRDVNAREYSTVPLLFHSSSDDTRLSR